MVHWKRILLEATVLLVSRWKWKGQTLLVLIFAYAGYSYSAHCCLTFCSLPSTRTANMLHVFLAGSSPLLSTLHTGHGGRGIYLVLQEPPSPWDCRAQYRMLDRLLGHNTSRPGGNTTATRIASSYACAWLPAVSCRRCTPGGLHDE